MDYFYDGQIRNMLSQFTRVFNNFKYETGVNHTGGKEILPVPCILGSYSRLQGVISRRNSENVALTAPFISCWISSMTVARNRTGNADHISQIVASEKKFNRETGRYENTPGESVLVERLMPVPYDFMMQVDIWSTNEEMKLQILEQILLLFNPSIDFQKNENPFDWTSKMIIELDSINYSSRSVPIGSDDSMEVTTLNFKIENFYLNPPAKVKKLKLINQINQSFTTDLELNTFDNLFSTTDTYLNSQLRIIGDEAKIISFNSNQAQWVSLLQNNEQTFQNNGYYKLLLYPNDYITSPIILDMISLSENDPQVSLVQLNVNSLPASTLPMVDEFIDPNIQFPNNGLDITVGRRYVIVNNIIPNTVAWGANSAKAGSIIEMTSGGNFTVVFNSDTETDLGQIVKNNDDGNLYVRLTETVWADIYQGTYRPGYWKIISTINGNSI